MTSPYRDPPASDAWSAEEWDRRGDNAQAHWDADRKAWKIGADVVKMYRDGAARARRAEAE